MRTLYNRLILATITKDLLDLDVMNLLDHDLAFGLNMSISKLSF